MDENDDITCMRLVCRGLWGSVEYAQCVNGRLPAKEFIEGLSSGEQAKLAHLFQWIADFGKIKNEEKFRHEDDKIYSFKAHQIRIGCFCSGRRWILTHGFMKKQNRWPAAELERAKRILAEFNSLKLPEPQ